TYLEAENVKYQSFTSTGKRIVKIGTPADASAVIYELIPSDGSMVFYFQAEGFSLSMLNQELQKAASNLNYTL
ncbi:copper resistance protein NlpE, partial [Parabacteroides merdae]|nr:copper resistance protein NlpE [Parabacteroides merdae]